MEEMWVLFIDTEKNSREGKSYLSQRTILTQEQISQELFSLQTVSWFLTKSEVLE